MTANWHQDADASFCQKNGRYLYGGTQVGALEVIFCSMAITPGANSFLLPIQETTPQADGALNAIITGNRCPRICNSKSGSIKKPGFRTPQLGWSTVFYSTLGILIDEAH